MKGGVLFMPRETHTGLALIVEQRQTAEVENPRTDLQDQSILTPIIVGGRLLRRSNLYLDANLDPNLRDARMSIEPSNDRGPYLVRRIEHYTAYSLPKPE